MAVAHKGSISLGLVLIPVGLYKTTIDNDIHFNQLCKDSKQRVQYKKYCRHCNKEVTSDDIIKGYEYEKGKYVVMTNEELEKIKTKKDKTIHILQFARMSEINMIYYEKDYYAVPETGAEKAYELLRQALLSQRKVAIAKTVMGTTEKLLVLYPTKEGIIVKTLFYQDEIAAMPKAVPKMKLDENEMEMAKMLIENMTKPFEPEAYRDEYQARLKEAITKKIHGQEIVAVDTSGPSNVIDLMEALKKSLELSGKHQRTGTKGKDIYSLILAKYEGASLAYRGHVTSGVTADTVSVLTVTGKSPIRLHPKANPDAVWVNPDHVCVVQYMPNTKNTLRQPVFKGYRQDVYPEEITGIP